jgi:hypothetical protein
MQNSVVSEKSRGIVAFAINTAATDYVEIANRTVKLASQKLSLPYTIITDDHMAGMNWHNYRYDVDLGNAVEWKNFGRNLAYELSPYDETLVIDVDYVVLDSSLLKIFDLPWDYLLQHHAQSLNNEPVPSVMGVHSLPYVWATVFAFRKTPQAQMFFDLVRRIQANYHYYRELFNVESRSYRNDYAFAMANIIINGFTLNSNSMPGAMLNILQPLQSMTIHNNQVIIKDKDMAYVVPCMNMHVMSKAYLQSDNFKKFIEHVTA